MGSFAPLRWFPQNGNTTLDNIGASEHQLFRYILVRNGHNVALYGGKNKADDDCRDRAARFPADDWAVIDREVARG